MNEDKGTILVVDDDQAVRSVVSRKMQAEGYNCMTAADGKEALETTAMQSFDMVLLDIKMPGVSGMEILSQMATENPDTCIIMITAVADTRTAVEAMKLGACDYVTKPFNLNDLSMRVEKALERKRLNKDYQLHQPNATS